MSPPSSPRAIALFRRIFPAAVQKTAQISDLGEQVNQAIRLILPVTIFGDQNSKNIVKDELCDKKRTDEISPASFAADVLELIGRLDLPEERDYLTRLWITETLAAEQLADSPLFPTEEYAKLLETITNPEEEQNAIFSLASHFSQKAQSAQNAADLAERLDDLNQYEEILRKIAITLETFPEDAPQPNRLAAESVEKIESLHGKARYGAEHAARIREKAEQAGLKEPTGPKEEARLKKQAEAGFAELPPGPEKDETLIFFCEKFLEEPFAELEPRLDLFDDPLAAVTRLADWLRHPGDSMNPEDDRTDHAAITVLLERLLAAPKALDSPPERRARLLVEAAAVYYGLGQNDTARKMVREILSLAAGLENRVAQSTITASVWSLLLDGGEIAAAERVAAALETATDAIQPDDMRLLLWREHLLAGLKRRAFRFVRQFLPKIRRLDRAAFLVAMKLTDGDPTIEIPDTQITPLLKPILDAPHPEDAAVRLVKLCRHAALPPVDSRIDRGENTDGMIRTPSSQTDSVEM